MTSQTSATNTGHPIGVPFATTVEFGDEYATPAELYDAKILVIEVVRGGRAWDAIRKASASNPRPKPGFEYLLASIRFDFSARSAPGNRHYVVTREQFTAMSADGHEYQPPSLPQWPKPTLGGRLASGASLEGWVVFMVPQKDTRPMMAFREEVGTILRRGAGSWFQLYYASGSRGPTQDSPIDIKLFARAGNPGSGMGSHRGLQVAHD